MSLNTIKLTPKLTADLYFNTLIEFSSNRAPDYELKYLGNNNSNVLLFVNNKEVPFVNDVEKTFLINILTACKLSVQDVCLVNLNLISSEKYQQVLKEIKSKIIIMFDVEPIYFGLPVNLPPFQVQKSDDKTYLHAPSLGKIEKEKELKQKLWSSLKQIFTV